MDPLIDSSTLLTVFSNGVGLIETDMAITKYVWRGIIYFLLALSNALCNHDLNVFCLQVSAVHREFSSVRLKAYHHPRFVQVGFNGTTWLSRHLSSKDSRDD